MSPLLKQYQLPFVVGIHMTFRFDISWYMVSGCVPLLVTQLLLREGNMITTLDVYDPCSQQIKNLGIFGELRESFFMGSYKESLLLLDRPDLHIYSEDS
nr:hypothetical protein [Tanacetum cinerariifolium]